MKKHSTPMHLISCLDDAFLTSLDISVLTGWSHSAIVDAIENTADLVALLDDECVGFGLKPDGSSFRFYALERALVEYFLQQLPVSTRPLVMEHLIAKEQSARLDLAVRELVAALP